MTLDILWHCKKHRKYIFYFERILKKMHIQQHLTILK